MQGNKPYQEKLFHDFRLSDRVPAENLYRRLKENLDLQYLYKSTRRYYGREGQKSIDPVVFMKLMLVGYLENLNSDRQIIRHSSMRMDILFFLGYDIDEELPWHSTLSRTRQLYGEDLFEQLFLKVLRMCVAKGMVSGRRQAIDSAYIKANASMDSLEEKSIEQEVQSYVRGLEEEDEEHRGSVKEHRPDKGSPTVSAEKHKEVERHHRWKKEAYKGQPRGGVPKENGSRDEHGDLVRPKFLSNHTHYSPTDVDARISVKPGKPRQLTYTAQTSVDTQAHVITHMMADYSDKRDSESLPGVIQGLQGNLESAGLCLKEVLADAGYSSGRAYRYLEEQGIEGYIPTFGQYKPEREGFLYNKELDRYECQRGHRALLPLKKIAPNSKGYVMKTYRSSARDCGGCPLRSSCIGKSDFKKLDDTIDKPLYDTMYQRVRTAKGRQMKHLRSSTVEPVLGTLINFMGMRRIWTRGISQAHKFMLGAATAYNLKKWLNYRPKGRGVIAMAQKAKKKLQAELNNLYFLKRSTQLWMVAERG
jgi:transposase